MRIIPSITKPLLAVVGCLHGNEIFGQRVIEYIAARHDLYPQVQLILANEEAIAANTRFIDEDLNRCFGRRRAQTHEQRLAQAILSAVADLPYLIDIHTTTSEITMTPIFTRDNSGVKTILGQTSAHEIMQAVPPLGDGALISHVPAGVSLEFNESYATGERALREVLDVIDGLVANRPGRQVPRRLFSLDRMLSVQTVIPPDARNFIYHNALGCYPFLLHEKHYTTYRGFGASSYKEIIV